MTEAQLEARLQHSYAVGVSAGMSRVADRLMELATQMWRTGDDEKAARLLRDLAKTFYGEAAEAHPGDPE